MCLEPPSSVSGQLSPSGTAWRVESGGTHPITLAARVALQPASQLPSSSLQPPGGQEGPQRSVGPSVGEPLGRSHTLLPDTHTFNPLKDPSRIPGRAGGAPPSQPPRPHTGHASSWGFTPMLRPEPHTGSVPRAS